jgi:hypothetical protein
VAGIRNSCGPCMRDVVASVSWYCRGRSVQRWHVKVQRKNWKRHLLRWTRQLR